MRKILLLLAAMALLLSCSDETTYVEYDADSVMVESYKELSNLDASNYSRGTRIFVRNEDCFYSWDGKSWNVRFLNLAIMSVAILPTVPSADAFCLGLRTLAGMIAVT